MKGDRLLSLLQSDMQGLARAAASLEKSLTKCADLAPSPRQSFEEEEGFDALTSRFARAADILTQKVLKTVVLILREAKVAKQEARGSLLTSEMTLGRDCGT